MTLPPPLPSGRANPPLSSAEEAHLFQTLLSGDLRDPFASDPNPDIRRLGRIALRREDDSERVNDSFELGDRCAALALGSDGRLRIFYVGKTLIAYRRAYAEALNDIDRRMAERAAVQFIAWTFAAAQGEPIGRNLAVALWAASEPPFAVPMASQDKSSQAAQFDSSGVWMSAYAQTNEDLSNAQRIAELLDLYRQSIISPVPPVEEHDDTEQNDDRTRTFDDLSSPLSQASLGDNTFSDGDLPPPTSFSDVDSTRFRTMTAPGKGALGEEVSKNTDVSAMGTLEQKIAELMKRLEMRRAEADRVAASEIDAQPNPLPNADFTLSDLGDEGNNASGFTQSAVSAPSLEDDAGGTMADVGIFPLVASHPADDPADPVALDSMERDMSAGLGDTGVYADSKSRATPAQNADAMTRPPESVERERQMQDIEAGEFVIGDRILDRYEVADVRRGGMGVVYLCYDRVTRDTVAIKSFQSRFLENARAVARFEGEALTWIRLEKHSHIVQARLVQNIDGKPHIMLEHISGPEGLDADLRSWIEKKRLTMPLAIEFGLHIALGMQHATQSIPSLIHRDLKPANILVTHDNIAKVTDFGLARSVDSEEGAWAGIESVPGITDGNERLTRAGAIIGTAPYMSPEQWRSGGDVDLRSDIYAFGCLLFEMLTGRYVFTVRKNEGWMHAHLGEAPIFPTEIAAALPPALIALTLRCLEKSPDARPSSWGAIVDSLAAVYETVFGKPPALEITGKALQARELMDKGYSLTELGRYEEAIDAYNRAIALNPSYDWAWARKGRTLRLLNRYPEALEAYASAIRIQPRYAWAWKGKGIVHERMGAVQEALECYRTATEYDPHDVWNWYNQADALQNLGEYDEALAKLEVALQVDPDHANSWGKLGQIYRLLKRYPEAAATYARAVEIDPAYAWAHNGQGLALKAMGATGDALLSFKRATQYQPKEFWHWYNLTEMLVDLKRFDEAIKPAQEAARLQPGNAMSWSKLGQVYRYAKRHEDALHAYTRAIAIQPENAWALNGKGIVLEGLNRLEEALESYTAAAQVAEADVWVWFNQGNVFTLLERYEEALSALRRALALNPFHARSWARLGNALRHLERYPEAVEAFDHATAIDPGYAWAWSEWGAAYEAMGQPQDARDAYEKAAAAMPDEPLYAYQTADVLMTLGDFETALERLDTAIKIEPRNARTLAKKGQVLRRLERHPEALETYRRALDLDPDYAWAWNGRGLALIGVGETENALRAFRRATELDADDVWYWYNLGEALINLNRFREGAEALENAVRCDPLHADSWAKWGQALRRLDRNQEALTAYDRALALQPSFAWAWNGRAMSLEALGRREEAAASYERALADDSSIIWYYTNYVDLLLELGRKRDALRVSDEAVAYLPDNALAWARRGQVQRRIEQYPAAIESYQRAVALDPDYGWAWNGMGLAYIALKQPSEAVGYFEKSVELNPNDVWFWHNLGEARYFLDDCPRALAAYERALTLDPGHEPTQRKQSLAFSTCPPED